jgi:hypothetical protein
MRRQQRAGRAHSSRSQRSWVASAAPVPQRHKRDRTDSHRQPGRGRAEDEQTRAGHWSRSARDGERHRTLGLRKRERRPRDRAQRPPGTTPVERRPSWRGERSRQRPRSTPPRTVGGDGEDRSPCRMLCHVAPRSPALQEQRDRGGAARATPIRSAARPQIRISGAGGESRMAEARRKQTRGRAPALETEQPIAALCPDCHTFVAR